MRAQEGPPWEGAADGAPRGGGARPRRCPEALGEAPRVPARSGRGRRGLRAVCEWQAQREAGA